MKTSIRKTNKYRLYRCDKRDQHLHDKINIIGIVWNHCLALQKRYYRLTGKYISKHRMQKHIGKLRNQSPRFAYWQQLGSQTTQLITHKLDDAFQRFFTKLARRPPKFRKVKLYRSITFTQAGWKLLGKNKVCSHCDNLQDMPLSYRVYECNCCGLILDRDHNAAKNIKRIGAFIQLPEACQTGTCACIAVDGRSLCL